MKKVEDRQIQQTRNTGTVHIYAKARLTSVAIQIQIWICIRIATKI